MIARWNCSADVNVVRKGSPSRIRRVRLISLGITILPRSSTRLTMPVAFIYLSPFLRQRPPCLKGAVSEADWGIYPSTAYAVPLPLGEGGFCPTIILQITMLLFVKGKILYCNYLLLRITMILYKCPG